MRWEKPLAEPVAMPAGALSGQGGLQVSLSPSLGAGLDGVRQWMSAYPYSCLEQRVSRAVALGDPAMWNSIAADLPQYLDSDGLLKFFPEMRDGSDILTSYVLSIAHEAGLKLPPQSEESMENGLRGFIGATWCATAWCPAPICRSGKSRPSRRCREPARRRPPCSAVSRSSPTYGPTQPLSNGGISSSACLTCPTAHAVSPRPSKSCARGLTGRAPARIFRTTTAGA